MPSNIEDLQEGNVRYYGPQHGIVIDNVDPEGLHRIRAEVPGIVEKTRWAWPRTAGGGSKGRGGHVVPDVGAEVVIEFVGGDPDGKVLYDGGWWGKPDSGPELPDDMQTGTSPEEIAKIQSLQIGRMRFTVNENAGKAAFSIVDNLTGDAIVWDLEKGVLQITTTTGIVLKSIGLVHIEAALVTLNDRPLLADTKGI